MNRRVAVAAMAAVMAVACSSASNDAGGASHADNSATTPVSAAECSSRCSAKVGTCGAPGAQAAAACEELCGGSVTSEQLDCLDGKDCAALAGAKDVDSLCPKTAAPATSSSGGQGAGTSPTSCSSTKTCTSDATGVSSCSVVSGVPVTRTEKCSQGKCKDAECGACTSISDCRGLASCTCNDGTSFGVSVSVACVSDRCALGAPDCGSCASRGGVKP